ncbi:MAG TPA: SRPBCC domain-containing protein [Chthoniobacterales bacterium]
MEKLEFAITINAPRAKVWSTMLADATYREWTSAFHAGSFYEGSWEQGSEIRFLIPEGDGMIARIAENRRHEFISIEHLGSIANGVADTESDAAKAIAGARENYTFTEAGGATTVTVNMDTTSEFTAIFAEMWPRALAKLKEVCER